MRISDWSSYVCSSDLGAKLQRKQHRQRHLWIDEAGGGAGEHQRDGRQQRAQMVPVAKKAQGAAEQQEGDDRLAALVDGGKAARIEGGRSRSEEHTSELQSLMRISYAVFCLKKKNKETSIENTTTRLDIQYYLSHNTPRH